MRPQHGHGALMRRLFVFPVIECGSDPYPNNLGVTWHDGYEDTAITGLLKPLHVGYLKLESGTAGDGTHDPCWSPAG